MKREIDSTRIICEYKTEGPSLKEIVEEDFSAYIKRKLVTASDQVRGEAQYE